VARQLEAKALRKLRKRKAIKLIEEKFELNYARLTEVVLSLFESTWSSIVRYSYKKYGSKIISLMNLESAKLRSLF
jgi:hypothetical protein